MTGALNFRFIEANLNHEHSKLISMDPYCQITIGNEKYSGEICKEGGNHPYWFDNITLQTSGETKCLLEVKEKHTILPDFVIGSCEIDLMEIEAQGKIAKWFTIRHNENVTGEVLLEISFNPGEFTMDEPAQHDLGSFMIRHHYYDKPESDIVSKRSDERKGKPDYTGQGGFIKADRSGLEKVVEEK